MPGQQRWRLDFYVQGGRLHYAHNYVGRAIYRVSGPDRLPAGRHQLRFEFAPTGKPDFAQGTGAPGLAQLYVDGQLIANTEFPVTTPIAFNPGGLTCGANPGSAIVPDYHAPFPFTGTLHTVTVDLSATSSPTPRVRYGWPWPASSPAAGDLMPP